MQRFRRTVHAAFLAWAFWASIPYVVISFLYIIRAGEISWTAASAYFLGTILTCLIAVTFMSWRSRALRVVTAIFLAAGFGADFGLQMANGSLPGLRGMPMGEIPEYIRLAVNEIRNVPDLAQDYARWIGLGFAAVALLAAAAWIKPVKPSGSHKTQLLLLPLAVAVAYFTIIQPHAVTRLQFMAPFYFTALAAKVYFLESANANVARLAPYFRPVMAPKVNKIVFIVDESVRGDYLSINNPNIDTTPLLAGLSAQALNYGVAAPVSNCSTATRLALRTGIRAKDLPDTGRKALSLPTIWQYARQAGMKTVHIDGFAKRNVLYSFMSRFELSQIEERMLPVERVAFLEIDNEAARLLNVFLERPEPMFIYVEKVGVHFPHDGRHAPTNLAYEPAKMAQFDVGQQSSHHDEIRHYLRSLRWRVDGFFERIAHQLKRDDVLFVYTSDHGQNMFEGRTKVQHCNARFDGEGSARVPLMVFTGDKTLKERLEATFGAWVGQASHEPLFPTLLSLMGYAPDDVQNAYGPSLFDQRPDGPREYILLDLFTGRKQTLE